SLPTSGGRLIQFDFQLRNALDQDWVDYLSHLKTLAPNPGMGRNFTARITAGFSGRGGNRALQARPRARGSIFRPLDDRAGKTPGRRLARSPARHAAPI